MKKARVFVPVAVATGSLLLPLGMAAAATTTVSSDVGSVLSLSSGGSVDLSVTPTTAGVQTIASDTVTVSTNDTAGYTLKLADGDTDTALTSGSDTISASSGTFASPAAQTANGWGYRVDNAGTFGAGPTSSASNAVIGAVKFAGVPASSAPDTIKTTSSVASGDSTTVWYGLAANDTLHTGTYSDDVTYTATAN